jgi:hypothetical protein
MAAPDLARDCRVSGSRAARLLFRWGDEVSGRLGILLRILSLGETASLVYRQKQEISIAKQI